MPYIGNQPFGKTVRTVTTETITSVKTDYYPNGGYMAGYVDVYVNGVRLSESLDFTATDGSLVTLLYSPSIGDTVEIVTYGSVEIANAVRRSGDTFSGNVYVGSNVYISTSTISVGNATVNTQITAGNIALNGSTLTIGNSTVNTVFTGDTVTVGGTLSLGNTAITGTANVTTAINVGANVSMNTTTIRVGNSTVNTYIVSDTIYGPSTLYIDPAAAGDNTGLVIVKGDLQVDGTTFTINSANVTVNDKNVVLASGAINNAATDGAGLTIYGTNANLTYNATGNNFEMSRGLSITGTANVSVGLNVGANVNLSTSQINVGNSTVNTVITSTALTTTSNTVTFGTSVYFAANGRIGIGNSSPVYPLTVMQSGSAVASYIGGSDVNTTNFQIFNTSGNSYITVGALGATGYSIGGWPSSTLVEGVPGTGGNLVLSAYTGKMLFQTNGRTTNMTLDSSGRLGIGTSSPSYALDIAGIASGGSNSIRLTPYQYQNSFIYMNRQASVGVGTYTSFEHQEGGTSYAWFRNYGSAYGSSLDSSVELWNNQNSFMRFGTNNTERMRLDSSGRLLIGLTSSISPGRSLQVSGQMVAVSGTVYTELDSNSGSAAGFVGTQSNHPVALKTNDVERIRIDTSGRLGIGVTSPQVLFHMGQGTLGLNSPYGTTSAVPAFTSTLISGEIHAGSSVSSGSDGGVLRISAGGETSGAGQKSGMDFNGYNTTDGGPKIRMYAGSSTPRLIIDYNGYVGIGTTSPTTTLKVDGIANIGGVLIGSPLNTTNDNSGCVMLHKLGQSNGYQFSGHIVANSWTGNAMIDVNIIADYTNDSVSYQVLSASTLNAGSSTKTTLQLVKVTYGGSSYLGIRKNGGGTATIFLNGATQSNVPYPFEIASGSYTVTSTIATLN